MKHGSHSTWQNKYEDVKKLWLCKSNLWLYTDFSDYEVLFDSLNFTFSQLLYFDKTDNRTEKKKNW